MRVQLGIMGGMAGVALGIFGKKIRRKRAEVFCLVILQGPTLDSALKENVQKVH